MMYILKIPTPKYKHLFPRNLSQPTDNQVTNVVDGIAEELPCVKLY